MFETPDLFLFKGFGPKEQTQRGVRRAKVLTVIHHACSWGKHQFAPGALAIAFRKLFKLFDEDPDTTELLTRANVTLSLTYKALVEEGKPTCYICSEWLF